MDVPNLMLQITAFLIAHSKRRSKGRCMIAQALRTQYNAWSVNVTADGVTFNMGDEWRYYYPLPAKAVPVLKRWDDGTEVRPFSVALASKQGFRRRISRPGPAKKPYKARKTKGKKMIGPVRCDRRFAGLAIIARQRGEVAAHKH